jgi:molybdate transport system ATP-binding protein
VVKKPPLLILDEPCQGLDAEQRAALLSAVQSAVTSASSTLIYVTHYVDEIPRWATHLLNLDGGRVKFAGPINAAHCGERSRPYGI